MPVFRKAFHFLIVTFLWIFLYAGFALAAPPLLIKTFVPDTIGQGSVSTLTFTLTNPNPTTLEGIDFTDTLPTGVTIAEPANATISCHNDLNEVLSAPGGGDSITLTDLDLEPGAVCTITVDVTSSTIGTHTNFIGSLTYDGTEEVSLDSATLTVDGTQPGFSKAFSPANINIGSRSTLTFTIDNSTFDGDDFPPDPIYSCSFTDILPTGLEIADPANVIVTGIDYATVIAQPGTQLISFACEATEPSFTSIAVGAVGTISVDIIATGGGTIVNSSSVLSGQSYVAEPFPNFPFFSGGKATAAIDVTVPQVSFSKSFTNDPVAPGGTATLEFTLKNNSRTETVEDIWFTDDLNAVLSGLESISGSIFDVCGPGSQLSGTSVLTLSGGSLDPEQEVTFSVTVQVPAGATAGIYTNTTSVLNYTISGSDYESPAATDNLFLYYTPTFTKEIIEDTVGAGGTLTLRFTITNTDPAALATDIAFTDDLSAFMDGVLINTLPADGFCGPDSTMLSTGGPPTSDPLVLNMTEGSLAPAGQEGDSATFEVLLTVPPGIPPNTYTNTTSALTCNLGMVNVVSLSASDNAADAVDQLPFGQIGIVVAPPAADSVDVVAAPVFRKSFTDDPVKAEDTVTLEFTIENPNGIALTDISFSDDFTAILSLPGLVAEDAFPMNDVCGAGSVLDVNVGSNILTLSNGSLAAGDPVNGTVTSETFSVTLRVPANADPGSHTNTTSAITAVGSSLQLAGNPASDDLMIAGLTLTKEFIDDPVLSDETVRTTTLRFTITNITTDTDFTDIFFIDDLDAALDGLVSTSGTIQDVCGMGSQISGTDTLIFTGGNLLAGEFCEFDVTVQVPANTASGNYVNTTSNFRGFAEGSLYLFDNSRDTLVVESPSDILSITKSFTNDPVSPGGTVDLEFTITNLSDTYTVEAIEFDDDLDAALTGLAYNGSPLSNIGGTGLGLSGTSILTLSGGELPPGDSVTFSVTLDVPNDAPLGTPIVNTTSDIEGKVDINGDGSEMIDVKGSPASDTLSLNTLVVTKSFEGNVTQGGQAVLTFTLENLDPVNAINNIGFTDDLDAFIPGATAVGLPMTVCGTAQVAGTSLITFSNGSLAPGDSCGFDVTVQIPVTTPAGSYINTISPVTSGGLMVGAPASGNLNIEQAVVGFDMNYAPTAVAIGQASTLTFTVDNTANTTANTNMNFTVNLPAGLAVATPANESATCTGGTITATAGSGTITYTGGSVSAGNTCTVTVDVVGSTSGNFSTSTTLTSFLGSVPASNTLRVNPPMGFSKAFAPNSIDPTDVSTLTFNIDNTGSTVAATSINFTDNLPTGVVVANPANESTTCSGGTITAVAGSGVIIYTGGSVPAGSTCTLSVDVTSDEPGSHLNTAGPLTSSLGNSGTAQASLGVAQPPAPGFAKVFGPDLIAPTETSTLTFTIDNTGSTLPATGLDFTDNLPAGLVVATPSNASTTCTGGALTAVAGSGIITYTGGTVPAGTTCTLTVDVTSDVPGSHVNTTENLTSSLGNSGTASDTLVVTQPGAPIFSKSFTPDTVVYSQISTLTFVIDNSSSTLPGTGLTFSDNLPAGLIISNTPNATASCTGGTLTALPNTSIIAYSGGTVAANSVCNISVDVRTQTPGEYTFSSTALLSSLGNSGIAEATLIVEEFVPIPTLSEWGMMILSLLLAAYSVYYLRRLKGGAHKA